MTDELEVLEPTGVAVEFRGESVEITPLTVGHLPRLVRMARPVIDALMALDPEALDKVAAVGADSDADQLGVVFDLVGEHGDAVIDAAAFCSGRNRDWVAGGDLAEFIALVRAVIGVNRDFFTRKLGPLLASQAKARAIGAGPTRSSS